MKYLYTNSYFSLIKGPTNSNTQLFSPGKSICQRLAYNQFAHVPLMDLVLTSEKELSTVLCPSKLASTRKYQS